MILVFFNVKLQASFVRIPSFCFPPAVNTDQITCLQRCHVVPGKQPAGLVILCWTIDGRCHCSLCSDRWGLVRDTHGSHFPESRRLIASVDSLSMTWLQLIIVRQVLGILAKLCRTVPRLVNVQPVMLLQGRRAWLCCHWDSHRATLNGLKLVWSTTWETTCLIFGGCEYSQSCHKSLSGIQSYS